MVWRRPWLLGLEKLHDDPIAFVIQWENIMVRKYRIIRRSSSIDVNWETNFKRKIFLFLINWDKNLFFTRNRKIAIIADRNSVPAINRFLSKNDSSEFREYIDIVINKSPVLQHSSALATWKHADITPGKTSIKIIFQQNSDQRRIKTKIFRRKDRRETAYRTNLREEM